MIKQLLLLLLLTTLITWFRLIYSFFLHIIWTIYQFVISKLDAIFAGGAVGAFFKNGLLLLLLSTLTTALLSFLTKLIFRRSVINFRENLSLFLVLCSASIALNATHTVTKISS